MDNEVLVEVRDLLTEVRDLLLPVSDAFRDGYERKLPEREQQRLNDIRGLLCNDARLRAWGLSDGTRAQAEIAREAGMDAGNASRFFKRLRELKAISESPNPKRTLGVRP